jgi:hypothetical protein
MVMKKFETFDIPRPELVGYKPARGERVMYKPKTGPNAIKYPNGVTGTIVGWLTDGFYTFKPDNEIFSINVKFNPFHEKSPFLKIDEKIPIFSSNSLKEKPKKDNREYIVEHPTGEVIYVSKKEKILLSDYGYIRYEAIKNIYLFRSNKRQMIDETLYYERKNVT